MQALIEIQQFCALTSYSTVYHKMRDYTLARDAQSVDNLWILQHFPVFTQGQAGKAEHILDPGNIPVVQSDRGGQVTYHGPGQLVLYAMCDLKRLGWSISAFTQHLQQSVITMLNQFGIPAELQPDAPGVYVQNAKICSLGLRVRKGCTYHGLSLNVNMDLSPFQRINPCGFHQLKMTQMHDFVPNISVPEVADALLPIFTAPWRHA